MKRQQTILRKTTFIGQALHSGRIITVNILPQPVNTGISFSRIDLVGSPTIKADMKNVINTNRCTTIGNAQYSIATIEHLMAAFHGLGIDNALVEVDGEELPAGDGSSLFFVKQLMKAGIQIQDQPRKYKLISDPIYIRKKVQNYGTVSTIMSSLVKTHFLESKI